MTLYYLARPRTLFEVSEQFGRHRSYVSRVIRAVIAVLDSKFGSRMYIGPHVISERQLRCMTAAVANKGGAALTFWGRQRSIYGFIDGNYRPTARPRLYQAAFYNGYYGHGLKFQATICADGIVYDFAGPFSVRSADGGIYKASMLEVRQHSKVVVSVAFPVA